MAQKANKAAATVAGAVIATAVLLLLQVCSFTYGDLRVAVREGALGDGLGAKVWSVCHIMVRWVGCMCVSSGGGALS